MSHKNKNLLYSGCIISLASGSFLSVMGVLLVRICSSLSITTAQTSFLLASNFIGYMALTFSGGFLAEVWGVKPVLIAALAGNTAGAAVMAAAPNLPAGCLGVFLIGGSSGILESMGCAVMGEVDPMQSDRYINLSSTLVAFGYAIGSGLAGAAMILTSGWRSVYVILTGIGCVSAFLMLPVYVSFQYKNTSIKLSDIRDRLTNPPFLLTCICMTCYVGIEVTVFNWLTSYLVEEAGIGVVLSTLTICSFYLALVVGRCIGGSLLKRWTATVLLRLFPTVSFFAILAIVHASTVPMLMMSAVLLGMMFSSIAPFIVSTGTKIDGSASSYSIIVGFGGIGTVLIPALVALIGNSLSLRAGISFTAPLLLVIPLVSFICFR